MFAFLEDKKGLLDMVGSMNENSAVSIGHENQDIRLRSFSIVTSYYKMGDSTGVVGVLGPTRMRYSKIVPLVRRIAGTMTEYMS